MVESPRTISQTPAVTPRTSNRHRTPSRILREASQPAPEVKKRKRKRAANKDKENLPNKRLDASVYQHIAAAALQLSQASSHDKKKRSTLSTKAKRPRGRPPLRSIDPNRSAASNKVAETVLPGVIDIRESTESTDPLSSSSTDISDDSSEDSEESLPSASQILSGNLGGKARSIASNMGSCVDIDDVPTPTLTVDMTSETHSPPRRLRTQGAPEYIGSKHLRFICIMRPGLKDPETARLVECPVSSQQTTEI